MSIQGTTTTPFLGGVQPFEYTGWRDESLSWHDTCYIHAGLNPIITYRVHGPEACEFLNHVCVNNFGIFPIGKGKHGIMCNEKGQIIGHGLVIRVAEDDFILYCANLWPYVEYALKKSGYNAEGEDLTGKVYCYQLGGPTSLEIIEAATKEDCHDIEFIHHRMSSINGKPVRIIRVGMAGSIAYEVHGPVEDALEIYDALIKAGEPFGLKKLGRHAYWNTHTENGFPQFVIHFPGAPVGTPDYEQYCIDSGFSFGATQLDCTGSMGTDIEQRYNNPYELGWGGMVSFKHDFVGKEALKTIKESNHRELVTLEWNTDDILAVYRTEFETGLPATPMYEAEDFEYTGKMEYRADKVLCNGKVIGMSTGRMTSWYFRKMISLCAIDPEYSKIGTEVKILWGDPGTRQMEVRATVARYPYNNDGRNQDADLNAIPRLYPKSERPITYKFQ